MNRRGFLASILAAGVAPFVMRDGIASQILMPVRQRVWTPQPREIWLNGEKQVIFQGFDFTEGLSAAAVAAQRQASAGLISVVFRECKFSSRSWQHLGTTTP